MARIKNTPVSPEKMAQFRTLRKKYGPRLRKADVAIMRKQKELERKQKRIHTLEGECNATTNRDKLKKKQVLLEKAKEAHEAVEKHIKAMQEGRKDLSEEFRHKQHYVMTGRL
jgi:hypothetical protein